jgi:uncharacterized integral membrane protein
MTRGGWFGVAALALLAAAFSFANRGESAAVHLGFTTFYRAPVSVLVLGSFLLGMVAMLLLGLRQDREVRRLLRERQVHRAHDSRDDAAELFPHRYSPPDLS